MGWFSDFFSDPIGTTIGTIGQIGQSIVDVTVDVVADVVSWFVDIPEFDNQSQAVDAALRTNEGILVNKQSNIGPEKLFRQPWSVFATVS